jgi:hypothetical protein
MVGGFNNYIFFFGCYLLPKIKKPAWLESCGLSKRFSLDMRQLGNYNHYQAKGNL